MGEGIGGELNGSLFRYTLLSPVVPVRSGLSSWEEDVKFFELLKNVEDRPFWASGRSKNVSWSTRRIVQFCRIWQRIFFVL